MNDKRREILIGYLLGVLEPHESAKVDAELRTNEYLRDDLAAIYQEIAPINEIVDDHEPPVGLATQTLSRLWAKIDAAQNSTITNALTGISNPRKKRRITVFQSDDGKPQEEIPSLQPHFIGQSKPESQDLNTDAVIPLSRALQLAAPSKPRKPSKVLRRVDQAESTPRETHLFYSDSVEIARSHPPKYYGREKKEIVKTPWTLRDIFASLLVGLTAAVLAFPLFQMGLGNFREMIIQKKLENVAKSVAPNTSQYSSPYGFSQNDVRVMAGMNIDLQSSSVFRSQQNNAVSPYLGLQESEPASSHAPVIHPVGISSRNSDRTYPSQ